MSNRIVSLLLLLLVLAACKKPVLMGSGVAVTETRPITSVERVSLRVSAELRLKQADEVSLRLTADDNIIGLLEERIENDTLILRVQGMLLFKLRLLFIMSLAYPTQMALAWQVQERL
ncbi:MAG: hypothetical protein R2865_08675 [Deinococcales bacterium]